MEKSAATWRWTVTLGVIVGTVFGVWNLLVTWWTPLLEDSAAGLLLFYGPMFVVWAVAGYVAVRRSGKIADGPKAGALVAFITFVVLSAFMIARVNLFLDQLTHRADWQNLLARYQASGFMSLRDYANYVYVLQTPFRILIPTVIGAVLGLIGGGIAGRVHALSRTA
jgi:hypothetical protein